MDSLQQVARRACSCCHTMTEELSAAMDRIEVLKAERDMARERVLYLEDTVSDLRKILEEWKR